MITYRYQAVSKDGMPVDGIIEAFDEAEAVARIRETCRLVTKITPVREKGGILTKEIGPKEIDLRSLSMMCSQFAIILKSGMPINRCVELIEDQTTNKKLKKILKNVQKDVAAGNSLADGFQSGPPGALPLTFVETVRAGEQSGTVEQSFENLAAFYESRSRTDQKIRSALAYPVFVAIIAVIVVIVVMVKVIPSLVSVFSDLGGNLPLPTRILIGMSEFVGKNILLITGLILAAVVAGKLYVRTENGRLKYNRFKLKVPVLGKIRRYHAAGQFAHTMETLLSSGLSMTNAVFITANTMDNFYLATETAKMSVWLEEGRRFGDCMRECGCYERTLNEMCAIGEESGELEQTLRVIAGYYDNQAEYEIQRAISKIEPARLILMALVAGFIVMAVYLPMFTMYDLM